MLLFFILKIDNVKYIYSGFPIFGKHIKVGAVKRGVEKWSPSLDYQILLNSWLCVRVALIFDAFVSIFLALLLWTCVKGDVQFFVCFFFCFLCGLSCVCPESPRHK
jgi:hypothetical protein